MEALLPGMWSPRSSSAATCPQNQAVTVEPGAGSVAFTCGMDLLRGSIVAQ